MTPWRNRTPEEWQAPVAGWPVRTVRRVIAGGRFEPYVDEHGVEVVPGPRDRRGVILGALGGVSAELDALPWDWRHEDSPSWGGQVIYVDPGDLGSYDFVTNARTQEVMRVTSVNPLRIERGPFA